MEEEEKDSKKFNLSNVFSDVKQFLIETVSIKTQADIQHTSDSIKENIAFTGTNVWVLVCSILIASIGLNNNSDAVIIGAMLISPLMGPIRGIGLGVGTNDFQTLIKSLKNFGRMVGISLLVAYLYFLLTPLKDLNDSLFARTGPHILDVVIAFVGGLAGIIAATTNDKNTVVPGVAIATALMPPLCTAGYGLAISNFEYFLGAFYLFLLNSVFICISTILVARYLKFPLVQFVNAKKEKKVKLYIFVFTALFIVPSIFKFVSIIQDSILKNNVNTFVTQVISSNKNIFVDYEIDSEIKDSTVLILKIDGEEVTQTREQDWNNQLKYFDLEKLHIKIIRLYNNSNIDTDNLKAEILGDMYKGQKVDLRSAEEKIKFLESQVYDLSKNDIDLEFFKKEINLEFPDVERFSFGRLLQPTDSVGVDTLHTLTVKWAENTSQNKVNTQSHLLTQKTKLHIEKQTGKFCDSVYIIRSY